MSKRYEKPPEPRPRIKQEKSPIPLALEIIQKESSGSDFLTPSNQSSTKSRPLTQVAVAKLNWHNKAKSFEHPSPQHSPPAPVTDLRSLKKFARGGGPDISDLRGYSQPHRRRATSSVLSEEASPKRRRTQTPGPSPQNGYMGETPSDSRLNPSDPTFLQALISNGVYTDSYRWPDTNLASPRYPKNWYDITHRIDPMRLSLVPFNQEAHSEFKAETTSQRTKVAAMSYFAYEIASDKGMPFIHSTMSLEFSNLHPLFERIVPARPGIFDGAHRDALDAEIKAALTQYIIPSNQAQAPLLPNFFVELRTRDESPSFAYNHAIYNGVLGARGVLHLQSYGLGGLVFDGNAYTITCTYCDGLLRLYAVFPAASASPKRLVDYHVTQIGGWDLMGSLTQFVAGVCAFRHLRQWAKEERDWIIEHANELALS